MKSQNQVLALLGIALLGGQAYAGIISIDFDNLPNGTTVTNQYSEVTFSSSGGDVILATNQVPPYQGTPPNVICSGVAGGAIDCTHQVILNFSVLVSDITFDAFGNQTPLGQPFATVDIYQNGTLTLPGIPLLVTHTSYCSPPTTPDCTPDPQSLNYANISEIVITPTALEIGNNGTAYDNFTFDDSNIIASVPEPSTLLLLGLCGITWTGRRLLGKRS